MSGQGMDHEGMRELQDIRETRPLADRLEQVTLRDAFTPEDRIFIASCAMMFVATTDAAGHLRVNGTARISADDPLIAGFPGAVFMIRVAALKIFPNRPRYIHKMQLVEHSAYAPRPDHVPPVPAWKTFDSFKDALPARERDSSKGE